MMHQVLLPGFRSKIVNFFIPYLYTSVSVCPHALTLTQALTCSCTLSVIMCAAKASINMLLLYIESNNLPT